MLADVENGPTTPRNASAEPVPGSGAQDRTMSPPLAAAVTAAPSAERLVVSWTCRERHAGGAAPSRPARTVERRASIDLRDGSVVDLDVPSATRETARELPRRVTALVEREGFAVRTLAADQRHVLASRVGSAADASWLWRIHASDDGALVGGMLQPEPGAAFFVWRRILVRVVPGTTLADGTSSGPAIRAIDIDTARVLWTVDVAVLGTAPPPLPRGGPAPGSATLPR
jgi:hypothetical protein